MRLNQRGVSLVELLIAVCVGWIVILGVTAFYVGALRFSSASSSQASLQRQASIVAEDIGRRLRSAQSVDIESPSASTGNCMPLSTSDPVLVIQDQASVFWCFYRSTGANPQIVRCSKPTFDAECTGGSILSGSLSALTATAWAVSAVTPCESADGTCDDSHVCSIAGQSCSTVPGANVSFTVADGVNPPVAFGLAFVFNRH